MSIKSTRKWLQEALNLVVPLTLAGCGTFLGNPESGGGKGDGDGDGKEVKPSGAPVTFALTDAPVDNAQSVFFTVASIAITPEDEHWIEVPLVAPTEIDLMKYQDGDSLKFAESVELPVGTYAHTRLMLTETPPPRLVLKDGTEHQLIIPSAERSGVKVRGEFEIKENEPLDLTLDFNLRKSIRRADGRHERFDRGSELQRRSEGEGREGLDARSVGESTYIMRPVLRLIVDATTGGIRGRSETAHAVCLYPSGALMDSNDDCDQALATARVKNGRFRLAFVPEGTYVLRFFQESGDPVDVSDVVVVAGQDTNVQP